MKFEVNFCQGLTLLSPPCSLPCCFLSACQNNEGKRNTGFGPEQGQPAQWRHEYSVLHMVLCIRIGIHLKALIRMLDLKKKWLQLLSRSLLSLFSSFSSLEREGERERKGGSPLVLDYSIVDWPVTKHWAAFIWEGEKMSCHIMPWITELKVLTLFKV